MIDHLGTLKDKVNSRQSALLFIIPNQLILSSEASCYFENYSNTKNSTMKARVTKVSSLKKNKSK